MCGRLVDADGFCTQYEEVRMSTEERDARWRARQGKVAKNAEPAPLEIA